MDAALAEQFLGRQHMGAREIVDVDITSAFKHSLAGAPTEASLAALGPVVSASMARPNRKRRALPLVVE